MDAAPAGAVPLSVALEKKVMADKTAIAKVFTKFFFFLIV
jgi:hypothetical protein